jgi:2'-5' RNA ligase
MYFIALVAPEEIEKQALRSKLWMQERFGCVVALRSPAHITLVPPFWMEDDLEDPLLGTMHFFCSGQHPFDLRLHNYSHFSARVIFIDVEDNPDLAKLQESLSDLLLTDTRYPVKKEDRPFQPHVTIAGRDLHKKAFQEAWQHFQNKKIDVQWNIHSVSLLKHNGRSWDVFNSATFGATSEKK